jgi:hypothetical protein
MGSPKTSTEITAKGLSFYSAFVAQDELVAKPIPASASHLIVNTDPHGMSPVDTPGIQITISIFRIKVEC